MIRIMGALVCVVLMGVATVQSWGQVTLNEILADPASDWDGDSLCSYRDDEWIEIYNTGGTAVDISAYWLSDADSTLLFNFSGMLGPTRHRVVYGSRAVEWQRATGNSVVGLSLNNTGDTVMLWRVEADSSQAGGLGNLRGESARLGDLTRALEVGAVLVDSYTYLNHEAEDDRSSGRIPDGGDLWEVFDGLNPCGGTQEPHGNGCLPTPGGGNGCPTAASERSWGSVKALYRLKE